MGQALKEFFSAALVRRLPDDIARVAPGFPRRAFVEPPRGRVALETRISLAVHTTRRPRRFSVGSFDVVDARRRPGRKGGA